MLEELFRSSKRATKAAGKRRLRHHRLDPDLNFRGLRPSGWQNFLLRSHRRRALGRSSPRGLPWHQEQSIQLHLSTAASLRANWLGIINVDVLAMADSEDKLAGALLYFYARVALVPPNSLRDGRRQAWMRQMRVGVMVN